MSSTDTHPSLLPGVSARTWQRVFQIFTWVGSAATLLAVLGNFVLARGSGFNFGYFIPVFVSYAVLYASIFVFSARNKKELAAGYTTLPRSNPTVVQLDDKSGEVLRAPGAPYLGRRGRGDTSMPTYGSSVVESSPPSRWLAVRSLWLFPFAAAIATFGIFARSGWLNPAGFVWLPVVFLGFIALVALIFFFVGLSARSTLGQVRAAAPGELVFVFSRSKPLWPALNQAGWALGELPLATSLAASANEHGLTVWRAGPVAKGLSIPWSSVVSVQADSIPTGNQSRPGVLITVTASDGQLVALPLANANPNAFPLVSMAGVQYLVAQLDQLRSGKASARLI